MVPPPSETQYTGTSRLSVLIRFVETLFARLQQANSHVSAQRVRFVRLPVIVAALHHRRVMDVLWIRLSVIKIRCK